MCDHLSDSPRCRGALATNLKDDGPPYSFCSVLLRMRLAFAHPVTGLPVVSYTAFSPLPGQKPGGYFLLRLLEGHPCRTLSGILPCEARTFLSRRLSALTAAITRSAFSYLNTIYSFFNCPFCRRSTPRYYLSRHQNSFPR